MVHVHVWPFSLTGKNIGHASLTIRGTGPEVYVSWWPKGSIKNLVYGPAIASDFASDVKSEGAPPYTVSLRRLSESRMCRAWEIWKRHLGWGMFGPNCCTAAGTLLRIGAPFETISADVEVVTYNHLLMAEPFYPDGVLLYAFRLKARGL